jgi:hypothetical protein
VHSIAFAAEEGGAVGAGRAGGGWRRHG